MIRVQLSSSYSTYSKKLILDVYRNNIYESIEKEIASLSSIACLVNNGGMSYPHFDDYGGAKCINWDFIQDMIMCNTHSIAVMTYLVLPRLLEQKSEASSAIINIGSFVATVTSPFHSLCGATKAFILHFSQSIAAELRLSSSSSSSSTTTTNGRKVIIQSVCPFYVVTAMSLVKRPSFFIPTPTDYVNSALNMLGVEEFTMGYFTHALQGCFNNIYESIEKEIASLSSIACLVNNVGMSYPHFDDYGGAKFMNCDFIQDMITCNTHSIAVMTYLVLPRLLKQNSEASSAIINIGSFAGTVTTPFGSLYGATKAFVHHFSQSIAAELRLSSSSSSSSTTTTNGRKVIIQSVCPFYVVTSMSRVKRPSFFIPTPTDYVNSALNMLGVEEFTMGYFTHALQGCFNNIYESIEKEIASLSSIACLVNNVGMSYPHFDDYGGAKFMNCDFIQDMITCNTHSIAVMTYLVLPRLLKQNSEASSAIINIGSFAGTVTTPFCSLYGATKAFILHFSQSIAAELRLSSSSSSSSTTTTNCQNVIIQTVCPFYVVTSMSRVKRPSFFIPTPTDYVNSALNMLGVEEFTMGYFTHALQGCFVNVVPLSWIHDKCKILAEKGRKKYG
uniref:Uncharacterized protein n=1 Tax=Trichobilharzia regenti TaxID=157069 RepID=A0AA85IYA3_TRIRE|nr:unnamed protein product [Trichobilharzia regenti]